MKIGFLSMPLTGHLHPMTALGRKMQARGHEVIFFGLPDAARIDHSAGLDFDPFGDEWQLGRQATRGPKGATIEQTSRESCRHHRLEQRNGIPHSRTVR
jgi:UDP:flavonoid glycosyltransferase YjiC (YdhE family)